MIKYLHIIHLILLSSFKASLFLSFYCILKKLNINQTLSNTNYTYILNFLTISIIIFKIYIGYLNYKKTFECIFNIYKFTKNFYISYCTIINYKYIEEDIYTSEYDIHDYTDGNYQNVPSRSRSYSNESYSNESFVDESFREDSYVNNINLASIKKTNMLYIKEILIVYVSHTIYIYTGILSNSSFFREFKKINSFISNEIQRVHYDFKYNNKELHSNYIELLILKNLISLKNNKYIVSNDYYILYDSFYHLQNYIHKLQTLSFKNNKILYGNYLINFILILNLLNLVFVQLKFTLNEQNNFNIYLDGIFIYIISFFIYFINDLSMIFINIFKNLDKLFDCENYIYTLNDELFLLNYLYLSNLEYKL